MTASLPSREKIVRAAQKQINVEFSDKRPHKNGDPLAERIADAILALATAPTPAAPRVGDACQMPDCCRKGVHGNENIIGGLIVCDYCTSKYFMPAPPAASADEREDRVQVADEMRSYFYEDAAECSPHKYAEFLQCADIALGYRKLAPAQSVGQSAAQGVFVPQSVWDWLMGEGDSFVDPEPPHPKYKRNFWWRKELRKRLSALPERPLMKKQIDDTARDVVAHKTGLTPAQVQHVLIEYEEAATALHDEPEWRALMHMSGPDTGYHQYAAGGTTVIMHVESYKSRGDWKSETGYTFKDIRFGTYGEARAAEIRANERPTAEIIGVTPLPKGQEHEG